MNGTIAPLIASLRSQQQIDYSKTTTHASFTWESPVLLQNDGEIMASTVFVMNVT